MVPDKARAKALAPRPFLITFSGIDGAGKTTQIEYLTSFLEKMCIRDSKMRAEVLTYSRARGLFAGIDLSGSSLTQDKDETRLLYGSFMPFSEILSGKVQPTASSEPFLTAVRRYSGQSRESSMNAPVN